MSDRDAFDALDRFLDVLRREIRDNPELAQRLVEAIGAEVSFDAEHAADLFSPVATYAEEGEAGVRRIAESLADADLRAVLKRCNLATPVDMKGRSGPELVDLLVRRAGDKLAERG